MVDDNDNNNDVVLMLSIFLLRPLFFFLLPILLPLPVLLCLKLNKSSTNLI